MSQKFWRHIWQLSVAWESLQITGSELFYDLRNISKLRLLVSKAEPDMIIHAFISSGLDYYNSLLTCFNKSVLDRLQLFRMLRQDF